VIAVVSRVSRAEVRVGGEVVGAIEAGMLILLGVVRGDDAARTRRLAERIARFRFFRDEAGRMDRSILESGGSALVVSQFTLVADGRKGRRPSFERAAPPELAEPLIELFVAVLDELGVPVRTGRFGALMAVESVGDGPVTFVLEEPVRAVGNAPKSLS